ncbi:maleylacetoacetate isomerase [Pseudogemmobacter humi]|uniref:Maleylpyruvate isomerase n=1 Tax=Pseudogemmobacter humi TaxID=2483812 RepID=A0A3P5WSY5_9RHOB|nr:maleylacetoacetate isomerase [Pseudogemmobacter humi]VDC19074.1 Maleylpyruvate isomerase [Pseudogemmobacter humi]
MTRPVLHNYFRSSTSYRVRIALALKGVDYDYTAWHLRKGEQRSEGFLVLNPQGLVPALEWQGATYSQSLAIIELLDEKIPTPPLLPADAEGRARVRSLAQMIALDIHPINNLRVLAYLKEHFGADEAAQADWFRHWVTLGFDALEARLASEPQTGSFCHGEAVGLADICLAAQIVNNRRFGLDMSRWPVTGAIGARLMEIDAFRRAAPDRQPDSE